MTHIPLLDQLALVALVAVGVTALLARLRWPATAGLLAAGALVGPYGLGWAHDVEAIEILAEMGVVLLLFSIGLEFSLARLKDFMGPVALGGILQVVLTSVVSTGAAVALGQSFAKSVLLGFVMALSSTAVVLRTLSDRRELDAPHGRIIVGTLLFQDLCVVPMMLVIPLLASTGGQTEATAWGDLWGILIKALVLVLGTVLLSRQVIPRLLAFVDGSGSREIFLLAILGLCTGTAWLTAHFGLSVALGAFLAGMMVAETDHGHRALGEIQPLRDAFVSLFFVSLGMLFQPGVVLEHPWLVGGLLLAFVGGKGFLATLAAMAMRFPSRVAWLAGIGLAQFGEFGFVLLRVAQQEKLVTASETAPWLAAGILSMVLTPMLSRLAPHVTAGERMLAGLERMMGARGIDEVTEQAESLQDHVLVVGMGLAGRLTTQTLQACRVPVVVLELNSDLVKKGREMGLPVYYADATSPEALEHAKVAKARLVVLLMNDLQAAQRVVSSIRQLAPTVPVLMRTRFLLEREPLLRLGARDVVAEEVEGAVEVIARMLRWIGIPRAVVESRVRSIRTGAHPTPRHHGTGPLPINMEEAPTDEDLQMVPAVVEAGSRIVGKPLSHLSLRASPDLRVVACRRGDDLLLDLSPDQPFLAGDLVYMVGSREALARGVSVFQGS
ncbi:MAG: cation:proton antiporter [Candidatus Sericytochromatia bacterium]|nr:cation:proton antiporter [Candidatus Sericytochromatia bacterium]